MARVLPASGAGRALYWLHDHALLPVAATLWSGPAPWSLAWLLPAALLGGLALIEALGLGAPIRRLQRGVGLFLLAQPVGRALLRRTRRNADGFLPVLAAGQVADALAGLKTQILFGETPDPASVARVRQIAGLAADLGRRDGSALLKLLEAAAVLAIADRNAPQRPLEHADAWASDPALRPHGERLREMRVLAVDGWADPDAGWTERARGAVFAAGARLEGNASPASEPETAALMLLTAARLALANPEGRIAALAWLSAWRRNRLRRALTGARGRDGQAEAEGLVDFEFWAALIEAAPDADAGHGLAATERDHGELFAATGRRAGDAA